MDQKKGNNNTMNVKIANCLFAIVTIVILCAASPSHASDLAIPLELGEPNFFGVGIGGYPDYFGSDDYTFGGGPIGKIMIGDERYIKIVVNDVRANLIEHKNWRFGPGLLYRFGRDDVDDEKVSKLEEIDGALNLGAWGGYTWRDPDNSRLQFGVSGWTYWDVSDATDNGWTVGANAWGLVPVATPVSLGFGAGTTWGNDDYTSTYFGVSQEGAMVSGLPAFDAGSGMRDIRVWAVGILHLSKKWHAGAGLLYSRMLGDAADSPIVDERGSKDQWIYGIGMLYSW